MKKLYIKTFLAALIALFSSCEILEENPEHILVSDNFYQTEGDAKAAITTIYNRLYSNVYERHLQLMVDLPTDDYKNGQGMNNSFLLDLEFLNITTQNQFVANTWRDHYDGINRANAALGNVPNINMDEELKNRLLGEAHFLRALYYFNLVRFFGDVPLVVDETKELSNLNVERTAAETVYGKIIEDLTFAEQNLPASYGSSDIGRATKGAAKILLGKVFLTRKEWDKAVSKLGEVVNNEGEYGYGLLDNFRDNWERNTENGQESVFTLQFMEAPGNGNILMRSAAPRNRVPGITGWEADIPTQEVYDLFDENDTRRAATFFTSYEKGGELYEFPWPLFYKYFDKVNEGATNNSNAKIHVLRYSDALLMYAEAVNELSGPTPESYDALNRVRERAFQNADMNYAGLSQDAFREAVYLERRLELVMECHRWFDLVRTGRFVETMKNHTENGGTFVQDFNVLMPVPQREIDTNPVLTQNTGYQ